MSHSQRDLELAIEKFLNYVREHKHSVEHTLNYHKNEYEARNFMAEHGREMLPKEAADCRLLLQIALERINEEQNGAR
jgi:hypothetical protein